MGIANALRVVGLTGIRNRELDCRGSGECAMEKRSVGRFLICPHEFSGDLALLLAHAREPGGAD